MLAPTFGALIPVDGPYQDAFRDGVGQVAQYPENVHRHCGIARLPPGTVSNETL